jgi:hypothetical protein
LESVLWEAGMVGLVTIDGMNEGSGDCNEDGKAERRKDKQRL